MDSQSSATPHSAFGAPRTAHDDRAQAEEPLRQVLLGPAANSLELPHLVELSGAIMAIAENRSSKTLLPLTTQPAELALVRDGDDIKVSYYSTESTPELFLWERRLPLSDLLEVTRSVLSSAHRASPRALYGRLFERAANTELCERASFPPVERQMGSPGEAPEGKALAFGFKASVPPPHGMELSASDRADIHSLLFAGRLWGHARGRRIELCNGPVFLPAQKMLVATRGLIEAAEAGKSVNLRLRSGTFGIGLRHARTGDVTVTLTADHDTVTVSSLDVRQVALPILSLVSELVRTLVSVDRSQGRNLRVRALREEIRRLRRSLKNRSAIQSFVNHDPDRLRPHQGNTKRNRSGGPPPVAQIGASRLRFAERWRFDVEELDANATFLCGDRLVIASNRRVLSLDRNDGQALWVRSTGPSQFFMAGQTLLRMDPEGQLELCSLEDGDGFAHTRIAPTLGRSATALHIGGPALPPAVLITEGVARLVAIDLRTGQPRWRFKAPCGPVDVSRSGRVLLVTSPDGALSAIDLTNGELVWRFHEPEIRFSSRPVVVGETVIGMAATGTPEESVVIGVDLYSGRTLWKRTVTGTPGSLPLALRRSNGGHLVVVSALESDGAKLRGLDSETGEPLWDAADPGLSGHGAPLCIDDRFLVNTPGGTVTCLDNDTGELVWRRTLSDSPSDEIPRRLEPVLRNGALFIPSASVHVLRPQDGQSIGPAICPHLVPDCLRVDERGWVYIAEESGLISAYSSGPMLTLIEGGASPIRAIRGPAES